MKHLALFTGIAVALVATGPLRGEDSTAPTNAPPSRRPALTEEQKAALEQKANEAWAKLSPEAKTRLMRLHKALTEMPWEERHFIHDRIERFLNMSPEEKQKLRENAERWKKMTPDEREQVRQKFRERRRQFEEQWKHDHPGEELPPFPFRPEPPAPPSQP